MTTHSLALFMTVALLAAPAAPRTRHRPTRYHFQATAFSIEGTTQAGTETHFGTAAADPRVLPLGTRVRISGAGPYDGTYVITDTGAKVAGRKIDIYLPNKAAAKRFGRKMIWVNVLNWGDREKPSEKASPRAGGSSRGTGPRNWK
jgi:3D (Asp-Asp-Asp) domain-containing protein